MGINGTTAANAAVRYREKGDILLSFGINWGRFWREQTQTSYDLTRFPVKTDKKPTLSSGTESVKMLSRSQVGYIAVENWYASALADVEAGNFFISVPRL